MTIHFIFVGTLLFMGFAASALFAQGASAGRIAFESFSYSGSDPLAASVDKRSFLNPILSGFYPDPSICRVGTDYYLINSSFAYFPGIPVFHSRDLVHWTQLGNVLDRPSQVESMRHASVSQGVFAAVIRYHAGTFYVINTQANSGGGNFIVTASNPAGPWSEPIWFRDIPGIDPSLFFDEGQKTFVVFNAEAPDEKPLYDGHRAIWLQEIDVAAGKTIGKRKLLVDGGTDLAKKPIWIEGPHLIKKDDWYVLIAAEGGTDIDHSEVAFRSRDLAGPYVPFDKNPILTQRHLPRARPNAVTCTGHADFVELPNGEWWAVFLGCRPNPDGHTLLGRETFMLPVRWKDGWPHILDETEAVPRIVKRPAVAEEVSPTWHTTTGDFTFTDYFKSATLDPGWIGIRTPDEQSWSLDAVGALLLKPLRARLTSQDSPAFLARRQQHAAYSVRTTLHFDKEISDCDAGLVVFQDERHHFFSGVRIRNGVASELFLERVCAQDAPEGKTLPEELKSVPLPAGCRRVSLEARGDDTSLSFAYRINDPMEWTVLAEHVDASILSTKSAGGFTGVCIGIHARRVEHHAE